MVSSDYDDNAELGLIWYVAVPMLAIFCNSYDLNVWTEQKIIW